MGKTRKPKRFMVTRDPNDKDTAENQDIKLPLKYRHIINHQKNIEKAKVQKDKKPVEEPKSTVEKIEEIRHVVNMTAKRETRKYKKRKEFHNRKKDVPVETDRGLEAEKRLVDVVKFGERVMEPPKINIVPKDRTKKITREQLVEKSKRAIDKKTKITTEVDGPKRKVKLKELSEADRLALLQERQKVIDQYRTNKQ